MGDDRVGAIRVGFGQAIITPGAEHWPIWLSGYGDRRDPADSVHDDLEVRVLIAADGDGDPLVLVALDLMAMSADWAGAVRTGVAAALDVTPDRVLTHTIHTHAAPSTITGTEALGWPVPVGWRDDLVRRCVEAATVARSAMRPATLRFARLGLPGALSFNRRGHAYEPTYAVVDVLDAERDERLGTIVNVGVHPVVLGPDNHAVSSDWVGVCRREVERRLGGTALFVQGCQGDVDPLGMSWTGDGPAPSHDVAFAAVERVGEDFALAAVAAAVVATPVVSTGVGDGDGDGGGGGVGATVRVLDVPCAGSPMARIAGRDSVRVELHEWSIGGVRIVAVPGEGFAELATRVLAARAGVPTIVCGLAPHWLGYLPVPFGDGYEEGLSYGEDAVGAIVRALEAVPQMGAAEAGGGGAGR